VKRLLIIENSPTAAHLLKAEAERRGYLPRVAIDLYNAAACLATDWPEAILFDWNNEQSRTNNEAAIDLALCKDVPVAILTANPANVTDRLRDLVADKRQGLAAPFELLNNQPTRRPTPCPLQ